MLEAIFTTNVEAIKVGGLTQWDKGQVISVICPDITELFQVHFAFKGSKEALVVNAADTTFEIPDELLMQSRDLVAYVYALGTDGSGETVKTIHLPVTPRAKPEDYTSDVTPSQMEQIESMFASMYEVANGHANNKSNPHGVTAAQVGASPAMVKNSTRLETQEAFEAVLLATFDAMANHSSAEVVYSNFGVANIPNYGANVYAKFYKSGSGYGTIECVSYSLEYGRFRYQIVKGVMYLEYYDPPMKLGVEYRTTERCNGKPVYCKLINCGSIASGHSNVEHGIANIEFVIRANGIGGGQPLPEIEGTSLTDAWSAYIVTVNKTAIYFHAGTSFAGTAVWVTLYYTKTTG